MFTWFRSWSYVKLIMFECILMLSEHLPPHHPRCFQAWSATSSHDGTHETESHEVSLLGSRFTLCHLAVCFSPVLFVAISQYINSSIVTTVVVHCNYPTILLLKCVVTIVMSYTQVCQGNRMHFRDQLTIDCHILSFHKQKQKQSFLHYVLMNTNFPNQCTVAGL